MTLTRQWAAMGAKLRAFTARMDATLPASRRPGKEADFAYESSPVDITRNGTYTLEYGPTAAGFNFPESPTAVVTYLPAGMHFHLGPAGYAYQMVTINGTRYLQASVAVSGLTAPYRHFTAWIY
jgi:phosphosulfolactate phosphohydrolase-like enzyme